jgi:4-hydroxy-tetrahydrodipicolinate reductase
MKIALIGYGKMGKQIEKICLERNHQISGIANENNEVENAISNADVAIEFTNPDSVLSNIEKCLVKNIPIVVGTTGWYDKITEVKEIVQNKNGSLLYASNFSIGANLFFEMSKKVSELMKRFVLDNSYSIAIEETHHIHKLDAPSGTAISLLNAVKSEMSFLPEPTQENINYEIAKEKNSDFILRSIRKGEVTGEHKLIFQSENDRIEIKHEAFNRKGFALGAVLSAEWLVNKKGFYTIQDFLGE